MMQGLLAKSLYALETLMDMSKKHGSADCECT